MYERENRYFSPDAIRDNARLILSRSTDILTFDYSSINRILAPILENFNENSSNITQERSKKPLDWELGITLSFDAVNFCFQDPYSKMEYGYIKNGKRIGRSSGLFAAMTDSDIDWGDFEKVAGLTFEKWQQIAQFGESNHLYLGPERGRRIAGLAQTASKISKGPLGLINALDNDSNKMLHFLAKSGYFNDEFLKRAQLTVRMLNDVFKSRNLPEFKNMDNLTAMADYRIPQVLYNLGVVSLSPSLEVKLNRKDIIESGSREEVALRATVIIAAEECAKIMDIDECNIDTLLWELSQKMAKAEQLPIPHMLVPTDKY